MSGGLSVPPRLAAFFSDADADTHASCFLETDAS